MIKLFNINDYKIDTSIFDHSLHASIVEEFENKFAEYVGASYACSVSSATNAIFLSLLDKNTVVQVPSIIPPVVLNAIINSGNRIKFVDNTEWVGDSYVLHDFGDYKIIDSAQKVEKDQYLKEASNDDLMIFSFYPTKPVGSLDGGIIVSNNYDKIRWFKAAVMNGMEYANNNWERKIKFAGWKMYMSSIQAYVATQNFYKLEDKKKILKQVREKYNKEFNLSNTSEHLYRINVKNRDNFIKQMKKLGISCGIHYAATHLLEPYSKYSEQVLPKSEISEKTTVSVPFNEKLTDINLQFIISSVKKHGEIIL